MSAGQSRPSSSTAIWPQRMRRPGSRVMARWTFCFRKTCQTRRGRRDSRRSMRDSKRSRDVPWPSGPMRTAREDGHSGVMGFFPAAAIRLLMCWNGRPDLCGGWRTRADSVWPPTPSSIREVLSSGRITVHSRSRPRAPLAPVGRCPTIQAARAVAVSHLAVPHHVMPTRNDIASFEAYGQEFAPHGAKVRGRRPEMRGRSAVEWVDPPRGVATEGSETPVLECRPRASKDMARMSAFKTAPGVLAVVGMPESKAFSGGMG